METDDILVIWDTTIPTARKIKANRPDTCLRAKKANTCPLSCSTDGNVGRKHAEKLAKYGDLRMEVISKPHVAMVVPVVLGALGTGTQVLHGGWTPQPAALAALTESGAFGSARILCKLMSSSV